MRKDPRTTQSDKMAAELLWAAHLTPLEDFVYEKPGSWAFSSFFRKNSLTLYNKRVSQETFGTPSFSFLLLTD
jgi:hypothetical protein